MEYWWYGYNVSCYKNKFSCFTHILHDYPFMFSNFQCIVDTEPQKPSITQNQPHFTHDLSSLELETLDKNEEEAEETWRAASTLGCPSL